MPVHQDASGVGLLLAARSGDVEFVRSLVRQGAELEQRDILGDSGLLKAARYGHAQVVKLLLVAGADVNAYDNNGWTAFAHVDREWPRGGGLRAPLQLSSASIDQHGGATTSNGDTPLHMAAFHGREWAVEKLLRLGANRGAINDRGERPVEVARHNTVRAMLGPSTGSPNQDEEPAVGFASSFEEGEGDVPRNIPTNTKFGHRTIGGGNGRENADPGAGVVEGVRRSFYETPSSKAKNRRVHRVLSQMEKSTLPSVEQESGKIGDNEQFDRSLNGSLVSSHVSTETEVRFASLQKRGSDSSFEEASSEGELSLDSRMAQHYPAEEIIQ
ncbi:unnamed protein product [Ectocarpus sp. CCAP 1310/34]|nr:unnamed protein product [Ectocarpus sp. CCAP 1310/34]